MPIYDKTLAANPQFKGAVELPEGGFRLFGNPEQPNYTEEYGIGATRQPYLKSQIFSGQQTTPVYSGMQELAKMKEEQEAAAFLLYGIAKKNAELMATAMPTPEGGKLMVPDPVILQLAGEGYAENKRQIDMWYKTGKMQIESIASNSLLNSSEQYQMADKLMIEVNSKRPVIIPQSATMPTMENIRTEAPQMQPAPETAPAPSKIERFANFVKDSTPENSKQVLGIINNLAVRAISGIEPQLTETEQGVLQKALTPDWLNVLKTIPDVVKEPTLNKVVTLISDFGDSMLGGIGAKTVVKGIEKGTNWFAEKIANKIKSVQQRFKLPVVKTETDYSVLLKGARYIDGKTGDIKVKP